VIKFPTSIQWVNLHATAGVAANSGFNEYVSCDVSAGCGANDQPVSVCEKMLSTIKGIIFDFDGTLFDNSLIAFRLVAANPFASLRLFNERLVRHRFAGRDFQTPEKYYRAFFSELGKACLKKPERMRNWYFNFYMPRMIRILKRHYHPRPGLKELMLRLGSPESALKAAVYSDYPVLFERMEALGLEHSQHIHLYGPESFGAQKPAPRPFLQIAKKFNLQPEEILVIGDREDTDGLGAFNAGMRFFCLETGSRRYFRVDPFRRKPNDEKQGPTLLMYAGTWDGLISLLFRRLS